MSMNRRKIQRLLLIAVMTALILVTGAAAAWAEGIPPLPTICYGTVEAADGSPVLGGTVKAFLNGTATGGSTYIRNGDFLALAVAAEDASATGEAITFSVVLNGTEYPATADRVLTWSEGAIVEGLVLTIALPTYVPVSGLTINPASLKMGPGQTAQLEVTITPANATYPELTFSSNHPLIATVSGGGLINAIKNGNSIIYVETKEGSQNAQVAVQVADILVTGVTVDPTILSLKVGASANLTATVSPADATNKSVTWSSSDPAVASVDSSGHVTALSQGSSTITVTTVDGGKTAVCNLTVSAVVVSGVSLDHSSATLTTGENLALTATVSPTDATDKSVAWSSSNSVVATVNSSGLVTAHAGGSCTITVTTNDGNKTATCTITVIVPVSGVSLNYSNYTLPVNQTLALTATVSPADATDTSVNWSSSNSAVATVDSNGLVTAHSAGSCTITVTTEDGGKTASCSITTVVPVSGVSLNLSSLEMVKGTSTTLTATVSPANATDKSVSWSSSDSAVATVNSSGLVTAINGGNCIISVTTTDGGKTDSCTVTVVVPVSGVSLNLSSLELAKGASATLTATVSPADATDKTVSWSSSNVTVATVDSNGLVTAHSAGSCIITATSNNGGKTDSCTVTVVVPVSGVSLNQSSLKLAVGTSATLTATVSPADATNKTVSWSSSNSAVATVDSNGLVTAGSAAGSCTITATTTNGGFSAGCNVTVYIPVTGISLSHSSETLVIGQSLVVIATVSPAEATDKSVSWSSSNPAVATVVNGLVTAGSIAGDCTITATTADGSKTATCSITVVVPVSSVSLDQNELTLHVGETATLIATVSPDTASNQAVSWQSSNPSIATVSNGQVSALQLGDCTITVTTADGGKTDVCLLTVAPVAVTGVSLNYSSRTLAVGETLALTATVSPAAATYQTVSWSSSQPAVAAVDSSGLVTALSAGSCTITVTTEDGGKTADCLITVVIPATGVTIAPQTLTLAVGQSQTMTATVLPVDASNKNVSWSSSNPAVATVNSSGLVTALSAGSCTITVTTEDGGKTAGCALTVVIPASGLEVTPATLMLPINQTAALTAIVSPANASNKNVVWSTSNPAVAAVNSSGQVTAGSAAGSCTITATTVDGGFSDSCEVTVYVPVTGVGLNYSNLALAPLQTRTMIATVQPAGASNKTISWSSSDSAVAEVIPIPSSSDSAIVLARAVGSAVITVTTAEGGFQAVCSINVRIPVTGISLNQSGLDLKINQTQLLTATVTPENATNKTVVWSTNNASVATVDNGGTVTAAGPGSCVITATTQDGNLTATCTVTVTVPVEGVILNKSTIVLPLGQTETLVANIIPSNASNKNVSWSTSNPAVATVSAGGLVSPVGAGTCTITVTTEDGNETSSCIVTVIIPVTGVSLNQSALTLGVTQSYTLLATVSPPNASNPAVTWSSSNPTIAAVNSSGQVTAGATPGTATITVKTSDGNKTATCTVTVIIPVSGVFLDRESLTLNQGAAETLTATVTPANASNKNVNWQSSNTAVATVSPTGQITAIGAGSCSITVTTVNGSFTDSCTVTVVVPVAGVSLNQSTINLVSGQNSTLLATVTPDNASNQTLTWSSSNSAVATVWVSPTDNKSCLVQAVGGGTCTITARSLDGNKTATCTITVTVPVTGVSMNQNSLALNLGGSAALAPVFQPANATNKNVSWQSNNTTVATVSPAGLVTAVGVGSCTVTVTTQDGGFSATCSVTVTVPVSSVSLNKTSLNLPLGGNETLIATVLPANATNKNVSWSSSNTAVATVSPAGLVTAVAVGGCTVTVTTQDGSKTAVCTVTVSTVAVTGVSLDKTSLTLPRGQSATLTATVSPANATNKAVNWMSSNQSVAEITVSGEFTAEITAVGAGSCIITVTTQNGAKTAQCNLTVIIPATAVSLNKSALTLNVNQVSTLIASVSPTNASNKVVTWSSSNPSIAAVDNTGQVTGISPGTCTVTITSQDGGFTAGCEVTVVVPVTAVGLDQSVLNLAVNGSAELTATIQPGNATDRRLVWSSSNPSIATVFASASDPTDNTGLIRGVSGGTTMITVRTVDGNKTATCTVNVRIGATGISLDKTSLNLNQGQNATLVATVTPPETTNKAVIWSSSNTTVASVSNGLVTAVGPGSCTITATAEDGGFSAGCAVTVVVPVTNISLNKTTTTLNVGGTETLAATIVPANASNKAVSWQSSNTAVATVDSSGLVRAVSLGSCTITVSSLDGARTATCTVAVVPIAVTGIVLDRSTLSLALEASSTLIATVSPANATNKTVNWVSSNSMVATVDASGKVTAVGVGNCTITATTVDGAKSAACTVTVFIPVSGVTLDKTSLSLIPGQNSNLTATINPANATDKRMTWSSSNPGIATVSEGGLVTAVAVGSCTITVSSTQDGSKTAVCTVTVAIPVSAVTLDKSTLNLAAGGSGLLTATVSPPNATNKTINWTSSDPAVATVSNGTVTAVGGGSCTITATTVDGGKTAVCTVTVTVPVSGVSLDRSTVSLGPAETTQLIATISPANAGNKTVNWTSSDPAVATVNTNGLVTAVAIGSCTITATTADGGKTAVCTVTVSVSVSSVNLNKNSLVLPIGESEILTATVLPVTAPNRNVTWQSSNPGVVNLLINGTNAELMVLAVKPGSCTITATSAEGNKTAACTITVPAPAPSLSADRSSADCGSAITVTAEAPGLNSPVYEFWLQSAQDGSWSCLQNYSGNKNFSFTRSVPGTYKVMVYVKEDSEPVSAARSSAPVYLSFNKIHAVSALAVTGPNGAQSVGSSAAFVATATDPGGDPRYQFWVHDAAGWRIVRDYSNVNTYTLSDLQLGSYVIAVYALDQADITAGNWSAAYYQVFIINVGSSVNLSAPAGARVGEPINLTAIATGITGCEYQFWYRDPAQNWHQNGGYQVSGNYSFTPAAAGSYQVVVFAKDHYAPATDQFSVTGYAAVEVSP